MRVGTSTLIGVWEHASVLVPSPNQLLLYTLTVNFARGKFMDEKLMEAMAVVKEILHRGNDAVIRKKSGGIVVLEEKKTIRYSAQ